MYAIIQDNTIVEFPILSIHQRFANISFPALITDADLPADVVRVHPVAPPAYNQLTHRPVQDVTPTLVNGRWELGYSLVELNAQEIQERYDTNAVQVRQERNDRLAASDWTQVADAPVDKTVWTTYRQSLRDISTQTDFPWSIIWPNKPE